MDLFSWTPEKTRPSVLQDMLDSFQLHTTKEEKSISEFLIKFDTCDPFIPPDDFFDNYDFDIKRYVWDRNGGRSALHEVQTILYKFIREDCKMVQVFADDFVFTRPEFVSDILKFQDTYAITTNEGTSGYAPCFSTRILDATSGTFGPHCNSDDFAEELRRHLMLQGGFDPFVGIARYYNRVDRPTLEDKSNALNAISQNLGGRGGSFDRLAKNVLARKLQDDKKENSQ